MDAKLQALIEAHSPHFKTTDDGKVECNLNGHTFPPRIDAIEAFINGKKYKNLKARKEAELNLQKWEPFLKQSINDQGMLFCALTGWLIPKNLDAIHKHIKGKKFTRAQERFKNDEQELFEEPDLDAMEAEEAAAEGNNDDDEAPDFMVPVDILIDEEGEDEGDEEEEGEGDEEGSLDSDGDDDDAMPSASEGEAEAKEKVAVKAQSSKKKGVANGKAKATGKAATGKKKAGGKIGANGAAGDGKGGGGGKRRNPSRHPAKKKRT